MATISPEGRPEGGPEETFTAFERQRAWAIHVFTASGAVIAMLALTAVTNGDPQAAFLWLGLAFVVDGLDGPLARRYRVLEVLPRISGETLDLVVDYLTYVVVPALMLASLGLLPEGWGAATAGVVLAVSLYTFANRDMKTDDNYFEGFPAVWNVLVLYMWVLETDPWANLAVIAVCAVLTFTRLKFTHPMRVVKLRLITLVFTAIWAALSLMMVMTYPEPPVWAVVVWIALVAYFLGLTAHRSLVSGS
ncbi:Phosphatidylcholine synthase [Candidatus Phaeomarinobacter ectocarpi]|uniref:Phosphatidylcholine synthase n=1 Tax=Candidatus Phaeomarinibacter ectocarpi TaxID=1458461 RepID=X5M851_9HYPH|nr:CDP-alcohol phosphatidyltransferase family protein [Candidatus Phaeomarinobacter ectocarpi]CDO59438.1 Phosphatidylcholine synthase [Candidatus Phaeomarinobacter ectocarpi]